jgi:hypothetical protein
MNQSDRILTPLEPPPGGWERLRARRNLASRWAPSWWALASGAAAAMAWLAIAPGHTQIRMQLTAGRLIGERSRGGGPADSGKRARHFPAVCGRECTNLRRRVREFDAREDKVTVGRIVDLPDTCQSHLTASGAGSPCRRRFR